MRRLGVETKTIEGMANEINSATDRRPPGCKRWLLPRRSFAFAALGRCPTHGNACSGVCSTVLHRQRRAGLAANRSRVPMGRRQSAEMGARREGPTLFGPSLAPGASTRRYERPPRVCAPPRRAERGGNQQTPGSLLALHLPRSRRASGAAPHGGRVVACVEASRVRACTVASYVCGYRPLAVVAEDQRCHVELPRWWARRQGEERIDRAMPGRKFPIFPRNCLQSIS